MINVSLLDLVVGVSGALDYVSQTVTGHHRRVAVSCIPMAREIGIDSCSSTDLLIAALLHDIGAFSLDLDLNALDFDADLTEHSVAGYRLLKGHPALLRAAQIIRNHHTPWHELQTRHEEADSEMLLLSNIVNLMDRVDILSKVGARAFTRDKIRDIIGNYSPLFYNEQAIEAFMDVSASPAFWESIRDETIQMREMADGLFNDRHIPEEQLIDFSRLFSYVIDFRSRHTATHSQGVAETATQLAKLAGMDEAETLRMRLAGNLHDIGKIALPLSLLDKPGKLKPIEFNHVQHHVQVGEQILKSISGLGEISDWACQHHERLNGKGYPYGLKEEALSLGSRIMAVADVYTAITEDRPYREGMTPEEARSVMTSLSKSGSLDSDIVGLLLDNFDELNAVRTIAQAKALRDFKMFRNASQDILT